MKEVKSKNSGIIYQAELKAVNAIGWPTHWNIYNKTGTMILTITEKELQENFESQVKEVKND